MVTTIHQPSSRLYMQLDKLLLLSQGHAMYYGHAQQAVDYFEALGFPIPPRVNAADFILDLASGEVMGDQKTGEEARVHLIACSEAFLANNPIDGFDMTRDEGALAALSTLSTTGLIEAQQKKDALEDSPQAGNGLSHAKSAIGTRSVKWIGASFRYVENLTASKLGRKGAAAADDGDTALGGSKDDRWGASFGMQIRILFQRSLRTRRFQSLSMQDICQLVIIAILAGLFWLQRGQQDTLAAGRDILGVLFFMLMFLSFRSLFVSLFTFPEEQRHMLKEVRRCISLANLPLAGMQFSSLLCLPYFPFLL